MPETIHLRYGRFLPDVKPRSKVLDKVLARKRAAECLRDDVDIGLSKAALFSLSRGPDTPVPSDQQARRALAAHQATVSKRILPDIALRGKGVLGTVRPYNYLKAERRPNGRANLRPLTRVIP